MEFFVEARRARPFIVTLILLVSCALALFPTPVRAENGVRLIITLPPNQSVGTPIVWRAEPTNPSDSLVYQFSVAPIGKEYQIVRDFNLYPVFQWTPLQEGQHQVRVVMKERTTGETWSVTATYNVAPLVTSNQRLVSATQHPLVALYSRPSCASGYVRVRYRAQGAAFWQYTNWRPCQPDKTINIYVGGMRAATTYEMQDEVVTGQAVNRSGSRTHTTGTPTVTIPVGGVANPIDASTSLLDSVLLMAPLFGDNLLTFPYATDLFGRLTWYYPNLGQTWQVGAYLMRPIYGGTMLVAVNYGDTGQMLREIDLAGNVVRETNTTEINEQLAILGEDPILSFHHDALRLANGHTLALANSERILNDVQGPGPVSILGDIILELDQNFQVTWVWNSFEKLDVTRAAVLNEICVPGDLACAGETSAPDTRDWTHSNSVDYIPTDGNIIISMRHQDWLVKIDYQNGEGSGDVIWRLGEGGDFTLDSDDPWPWFSHQHYARYWGEDSIVLFDNGNTRCVTQPQPCNSRGQVYTLDETNLTASLAVNADLGIYTAAWGAGMRLINGNYHFTASRVNPYVTRSIEVDPTSMEVYRFDTTVAAYRSFRMPSLYVPEVNPVTLASLGAVATLPAGEVAEPEQIGTMPIYLPYVNAGADAPSAP